MERGRKRPRYVPEPTRPRLLGRLLAFLADRDDVRVAGPVDPTRRAPTVSIVPAEAARALMWRSRLVDRKMMIGVGDFYAPRLLNEMGIPTAPGVLRMSFIHYTTEEEIDRLIEALNLALG